MRVLVTGIGGFVGPVLADALVAAGHGVHGLVRGAVGPRLARLASSPLTRGDLLDPTGWRSAPCDDAAPEAVVHLAGLTFAPARRRRIRARAYRANVDATLALLAAVRARAPREPHPRRQLGRGLRAGAADAGCRSAEDAPLRPVTIYGASQGRRRRGGRCSGAAPTASTWCARGRSTTPDPGRRTRSSARPSPARWPRSRPVTQPPLLRVGNLDPVRDFSDVRDIARGYVALLERGRSGEVYNLCSRRGREHRRGAGAAAHAGAGCRSRVERDPALVRPVDLPRSIGSARPRGRATPAGAPTSRSSETLSRRSGRLACSGSRRGAGARLGLQAAAPAAAILPGDHGARSIALSSSCFSSTAGSAPRTCAR